MKRSKKLISLLAVLVVLIGAALLATKLNPENQEAEEEESLSVRIYTMNTEDAAAISWTYGGETLTFVKDGESWIYEADEVFPLKEFTSSPCWTRWTTWWPPRPSKIRRM